MIKFKKSDEKGMVIKMKFIYDKDDWTNIKDGEKNCFLMTNGLGGYSSLTVTGGAARGDHALLMSAKKAPNVRFNLVANISEKIIIDEREYFLTSQSMKSGNNYEGFRYLEGFIYDDLNEDETKASATWFYSINGIKITKSLLMVHGENTVALNYELNGISDKRISIEITPLLRFCPKKDSFDENQNLQAYRIVCGEEAHKNIRYRMVKDDEALLWGASNARLEEIEPELFGKMYFSQDERDGREKYGNAFINHKLTYNFSDMDENKVTVIFSTKQYVFSGNLFSELAHNEKTRKQELIKNAGLKSELGKQLVISSDSYVVRRESTNGMSIIAGYPFFEDWGRDTMISLAGATIVTRRFNECKSILRTFAKYVKNGLLPNLFPEGGENPMYNSADAPLLFINSVYEYIEYSGDYSFKDEILPVLKQIVTAYINGTDFHIKMDSDGLIMAGDDLEQLTWMDVRVGDFLPTPRHGKPVEINAYWYSALRIMEKLTGEAEYMRLADKVRNSFNREFWNENDQCLKDVLSGKADENQIRCNQIWAITMPFTMLSPEREELVIKKVKEELYTTAGLRTLSMKDKDFHSIYIGGMQERDRAYHQGTVWAFPLGAYYRACIRFISQNNNEDKIKNMQSEVVNGMEELKYWLKEGCAAQIAEIYDGEKPTVSRGCFAQAWSVCELLRAVYDYEKLKPF
jgi:predicted glycogen debranching enzyme